MKQDEAEKLARLLLDGCERPDADEFLTISGRFKVGRDLAKMILSGDMKREIENAAYERVCERMAGVALRPSDRAAVREAIRSLIQPPAQKDNGE